MIGPAGCSDVGRASALWRWRLVVLAGVCVAVRDVCFCAFVSGVPLCLWVACG